MNIKFEKVSFEQFLADVKKTQPVIMMTDISDDEQIREIYDNIKLPRRSTRGSAGYDFYMPFTTAMFTGDAIVVPTGIRVIMPDEMFLMIVPRSGLGFKHHVSLTNTVGIIDSDYCNADNEGHVMVKLFYPNDLHPSSDTIPLHAQDRFCQGIFMPFYVTDDDKPVSEDREGGIGSTGE